MYKSANSMRVLTMRIEQKYAMAMYRCTDRYRNRLMQLNRPKQTHDATVNSQKLKLKTMRNNVFLLRFFFTIFNVIDESLSPIVVVIVVIVVIVVVYVCAMYFSTPMPIMSNHRCKMENSITRTKKRKHAKVLRPYAKMMAAGK